MRLPLLLFVPAFATACAGDVDERLRFADLSPEARARLVLAATGLDAELAGRTIDRLIEADASCPRIARDGGLVYVVGDCARDGVRYQGRVIRSRNDAGGGYLFEDWRVLRDDRTDRWRGLWASSGADLSDQLDVEYAGLGRASTNLEVRCLVPGECVPQYAPIVVRDGFEAIDLQGTWRRDGERVVTTVVELIAGDTLAADRSQAVDGCVPMTIDGADAGTACLPPL